MGFWGTIAFLRIEQPAHTLTALRTWAADGMELWSAGDGWQGIHYGHDSDVDWRAVLLEVMRETGRPVVGAFVLDSDGACVLGADPQNGTWGAVLEIEGVLSHLVVPEVEWPDGARTPLLLDDDPDYLREREEARAALTGVCGPVDEAARRAVRWAAESGYRVETKPVVQAMKTTGGFVEEAFMLLVTALGLPDPAGAGNA